MAALSPFFAFDFTAISCKLFDIRQSGEIGKHNRLKIGRRKACGFKSRLWHN